MLSCTHKGQLYRYNVSSLIELMVSMINTYAELMKSRCSKAVAEALEEDEFYPMVLQNAKEYDETKLGFPFEQEKKAATADGAPIVHRGRGGMAQPMTRMLEYAFPVYIIFVSQI